MEEEIKIVRSKHFIKLMSDQLEALLEELISIWYPQEFTKDFRQVRDYITYEDLTWKVRGYLKYCLNSDSKIVFGHNNLRLDNII